MELPWTASLFRLADSLPFHPSLLLLTFLFPCLLSLFFQRKEGESKEEGGRKEEWDRGKDSFLFPPSSLPSLSPPSSSLPLSPLYLSSNSSLPPPSTVSLHLQSTDHKYEVAGTSTDDPVSTLIYKVRHLCVHNSVLPDSAHFLPACLVGTVELSFRVLELKL